MNCQIHKNIKESNNLGCNKEARKKGEYTIRFYLHKTVENTH